MSRVLSVTSNTNATYKKFLELLDSKGVRKHDLALVSGEKVVTEYLEKSIDDVEYLIGSSEMRLNGRYRVKMVELTGLLFKKLDVYGTQSPLIVIKVPQLKTFSEDDLKEGCILFVPFQDPVNAGSVIRSAAGLGVKQVVMLEEAANPFHPRTLRAASGALRAVELFKGPPIQNLKLSTIPLYALDSEGRSIRELKFPKTFGLVAGIEGPGFPPEFNPTEFIRLPMDDGVESFNAMVAASFAMYEWRRSLKG